MTLLMVVLAKDSMSVSSRESSLVFNFLGALGKGSRSSIAADFAVAGAIQLSGFVLTGVMIGEFTRAHAAQGLVVYF